MKEISRETIVKLDTFDPDTGEVFQINGSVIKSEKYYNIKKLNKRICIMDLFTMQSKICNSNKSIEIFRDILYETNRENIFDKNITKFAKENGYTRQQVSSILKKFIDVGMAKRIERGKYLLNPFAFQSKGSTNKLIEEAQELWRTTLVGGS